MYHLNCSLAALTLFLFPLVLTTFSISLRVGCFSLSRNTYSTKTLAAAGRPVERTRVYHSRRTLPQIFCTAVEGTRLCAVRTSRCKPVLPPFEVPLKLNKLHDFVNDKLRRVPFFFG